MTLEASGPALAQGLRETGERREAGLRRRRAAAWASWFLLARVSWALAGSVRQSSGACSQPIPPRGPAARQPEESRGGQEAACRAGRPPLGSSPSPRGPALLSRPPGGPPGAGFPPTLGFWRFQSLCFWWRLPPFSRLLFKAFSTISPVSVSVNPATPNSHSLANTAAARERT